MSGHPEQDEFIFEGAGISDGYLERFNVMFGAVDESHSYEHIMQQLQQYVSENSLLHKQAAQDHDTFKAVHADLLRHRIQKLDIPNLYKTKMIAVVDKIDDTIETQSQNFG